MTLQVGSLFLLLARPPLPPPKKSYHLYHCVSVCVCVFHPFNVSSALTDFFFFSFSMSFIVWKIARWFHPSLYTKICLRKNSDEKGKRRRVEELGGGSGRWQPWVKVLLLETYSVILLWYWRSQCFWKRHCQGERMGHAWGQVSKGGCVERRHAWIVPVVLWQL